MRWLAAIAGLALGAAGAAVGIVAGCGSTTETGDDADAGVLGDATIVVLHPDAAPLPGQSSCEVVITTGISIGSVKHVDLCTPVVYPTNPPSGGNHWPEWAGYQEYTQAVPREMYVHNMEHDAVVLAYRCSSGCSAIVAALEKASLSAPSDCPELPNAAHSRVLITPDPKLLQPIGVGAWGATYTATCIDPESLATFVKEAYGKGREHICTDGIGLPTVCDGG